MSKKIKAVIAIGGTGGHVIPGYNLALHLNENNFTVDVVTDTRGLKYLKSSKNFKIHTFPSSPLIKKKDRKFLWIKNEDNNRKSKKHSY